MVRDGPKPVLDVRALPPGPRRTLRAALRGGIVGSPGPHLRRHARELLEPRLVELDRADPALPLLTRSLARCVGEVLASFARARAARDLASAFMWRRVLHRRALQSVVVPNDVVPELRLIVSLAQERGIPTLAVQHGVYLPPTPGIPEDPIDDRLEDLEVADKIAVWSELTASALPDRADSVHVVGYPVPYSVAPPRIVEEPGRPRVVVLVQGPERTTALGSERMIGEHSEAAVRVTLDRFPRAKVTLRPHPSHDIRAVEAVLSRFPGADVSVDAATPIMEVLSGHHICIGSKSTASYQAALAGCAVVILNLTGSEWKWPLGGETPVPVARSKDELAAALTHAASSPNGLPGREELLTALGAGKGNGSARLSEAVRGLTPHGTHSRY
jgi:hypothetical protein